MGQAEVVVSSPDLPSPASVARGPFAVLLDTRDPEWNDRLWIDHKAVELLDAGCRYFVCFGPESERVHDQIDDVIVDRQYDVSVLTTFHDDETIADVAKFFLAVAMGDMANGLVLARNMHDWRTEI